MNNSLTGIKNLFWAFFIVTATAAVTIGILITFFVRYSGDKQDGTLYLGSSASDKIDDDIFGVPADSDTEGDSGLSGLTALPNTQDTGLEYLFNLTFLCDESFSAVNSYGANFGSTASSQVWLPSSGSFPVASASSVKIIYPNDGTEKTVSTAVSTYAPSRLVIYLGADSLANTTSDSFISGYTSLIQAVKSSNSGTTVICCSIGSVTSGYASADGLTAAQITQANQWIKQVCASTGVYYADLASILNDDSGYLSDQYAAEDGHSINSSGISAVMEYFRYHGV
jgi:enamine deaminase RidA (YjgF/YER057c/UK114 family)